MANETIASGTPATDPTAGTPPAGTPPAGTPPAGTPPAGTPPAGTPPAGTPPAGDGKTIGQGGVDPANKGPADWPGDWREKMAGDDKAYLETLKRYASPPDVYKKMRELETLVSSGKHKQSNKPPENATPEQITAWRKENGIPETAEGYVQQLQLPDGMTLGEADKPIATGFAEAAQEAGLSPAQFSRMTQQYYKLQDVELKAREAADHTFKTNSEQALHNEWGPEFQANINAMNVSLSRLPEKLQDDLLGGRLADGTKIGNHPDLVKWLSSLGREIDPASTVLPVGMGGGGMKGVEARIAEIEGLQKSDPRAYWKNEKVQEELRGLYDAREKLSAKAQG